MNKVLYLKNVNETSRFYFDIKINFKTLLNLVMEFTEDSVDLSAMSKKLSFKIIDKSQKRSIEVNKEYIAFFPLITADQEINEIRERIYKHVAKKSDVYQRTAKENELLATSSLVTGELRATASLLYYCFHKFINSRMFFYFNDVLKLDDYKIDIIELKHFTSSEYKQFIDKQLEVGEINKDNYHKVLNKRIRPFLLLRYIITENFDRLNEILLPYISFISNKLFTGDFEQDSKPLIDELEKRINEFNSLKTKPGQEIEVEAAIAVALKSYLESKNDPQKSLWLLDIIALRLYLLRQTADYAYDFEVKTSTREMSLLLNTIQNFINYFINTLEQVQQKEGIDELQRNLDTVKFPSLNEQEKLNIRNEIVKYYNVKIKFPEEIKQEQTEISTYMTAVHLDSNFDKSKIMELLNLSSNIRNEGKNFIFENSNPLSKHIYLYINDDGRWTVWFVKDKENSHILTSSDLINSFQELVNTLMKNCQIFFGEELNAILAASYPVYSNNFSNLSTTTILNFMESIKYKEKVLKNNVTSHIAKHLKLSRNNNIIKFNGINIIINVYLSSEQDKLGIPLTTLMKAKFSGKQINNAYLSIIINDKNKNSANNVDYLNGVYEVFVDDLGFKDSIRGNEIIDINSKQIDDLIYKSDRDSKVFEGLARLLNHVAYEMVNRGEINASSKDFINKSIEAYPTYSFSYATLGMWYLRNNELETSESLENGIKFYNKALEVEKTEGNAEFTISMKQKFLYERAVFSFFRKNMYEEAVSFINEGIELNQEGSFYDKLVELKKELNLLIEPIKQISVSESSNFVNEKKLSKKRLGKSGIRRRRKSPRAKVRKGEEGALHRNPRRKKYVKK